MKLFPTLLKGGCNCRVLRFPILSVKQKRLTKLSLHATLRSVFYTLILLYCSIELETLRKPVDFIFPVIVHVKNVNTSTITISVQSLSLTLHTSRRICMKLNSLIVCYLYADFSIFSLSTEKHQNLRRDI